MMIDLSPEQQAVKEDHRPICVTACAGSGKTRTAVHRLANMRAALMGQRGRLALLSFSNVAVDTFRADYRKLLEQEPPSPAMPQVEIATVDAFITSLIVRPHAYRTMHAPRSAYLVAGTEPFLNGFMFFDGNHNQPVRLLSHERQGAADVFKFRNGYALTTVNTAEAVKGVSRLGKTGAYTHDLGRYWALRTLVENPPLTQALARRYPVIMIDEAQDIGSTQEAIFDLLIAAGSQLSLIGDVNQGIFEFAGATGEFLTRFGKHPDVTAHSLTVNYRSVPHIVEVANTITGRNDKANRSSPGGLRGAYVVSYLPAQPNALIETFRSMIAASGLSEKDSAIVCRSAPLAQRFGGVDEPAGQGTVRDLVLASLYRDQLGSHSEAFKIVLRSIAALLEDSHRDIVSKVARGGPDVAKLRRLVWNFTHDGDDGLPVGTLIADTQWHPKLVRNIKALLARLDADFGLKSCATVGQRLKRTALPNTALFHAPDAAAPAVAKIRTETVHQVKGESIDAVMYVANRQHACELLSGPITEDGKIGYVALTRARELFVFAIPQGSLAELRPLFLGKGFKEPTA